MSIKGWSYSLADIFLYKIEGLTAPRKGQKEFNVATGKVKWFNRQKGYGFIIPDEGEKDLFVHHSNIDSEGFRSLEDGQSVEFEVQDGTKGPEAIKVRPL